MDVQSALTTLLRQLDEMLQQLSARQYSQPIPVLSGATIGQHCRHIIECFEEMEKGYAIGVICYDNRRRDPLLETDPQCARRRIAQLKTNLDRPDRPLFLYATLPNETVLSLSSSYYRELYHNIDHAVHHMALIRTGMFPDIQLPVSFGVAWSTLKFHAATVSQKLN